MPQRGLKDKGLGYLAMSHPSSWKKEKIAKAVLPPLTLGSQLLRD